MLQAETKTEKNVQLSIKLKGSLFTMTALQLLDANLPQVIKDLQQQINLHPHFFNAAPLVLDFAHCPKSTGFPLKELIIQIKMLGLIPVGIRCASESLRLQAQEIGLALFPESRDVETQESKPSDKKTIHAANQKQAVSQSPTKLVVNAVRSGQQIYAKGGDLIVLGPVSVGAELLADGHIHVYGTLRGRALAGVHGDTSARIFCQKLDAELISIAGIYKIQDDLPDPSGNGRLTQIYLEQERIVIVQE